MDSFEFNKIAGAVLGTLTFVMLVSFGGELLFAEKKAAKAGYELPTGIAASSTTAAAVAVEPIAVRLAAADKAKGENTFKQCATCHTPDKGGANKVGPNMWGVVERAKGQVAGFGYSAALKGVAAKGEKWSFEALDKFLESPKGYLAGTSMSYAGISNPKTRADLIAYLNGLSDAPIAIPK
ncbi:MAG: c-type cytochrome [Beijerinckiaceae bacterium]